MFTSYDILFKDHLGIEKSIKDSITKLEVYAEKGRAYKTLTIEVGNLYIDSSLARDKAIRVVLILDKDGDKKTENYYIDDIKYMNKKKATIICKTEGVLLNKEYSGTQNYYASGTAKAVLEDVLQNYNYDFSKLTDFNILDFNMSDLSFIEIIEKILSITKADIYVANSTITITDKQKIALNDVAVYSYDTLRSIIRFETNTNKDEDKINKIYFNTEATEDIFSEPMITISIDPSPQPLSPSSVLVYIDEDGNEYKIKPVKAKAIVFYTPLSSEPTINGLTMDKKIDYKIVEKYELENESFLRVSAGIKSIVAIQVNDTAYVNFTFDDNVIFFNEPITGEVDISYTSDVYLAYIDDNSNKEKTLKISIKHFDQLLNYEHTWEADGYYPIPYNYELNLIKDWNVSTQDAVNATGDVLKVDSNGVKTIVGSWSADAFGEVDITFNDYGVYVLALTGYDDLYIKFYVNSFDIDITPIVPYSST